MIFSPRPDCIFLNTKQWSTLYLSQHIALLYINILFLLSKRCSTISTAPCSYRSLRIGISTHIHIGPVSSQRTLLSSCLLPFKSHSRSFCPVGQEPVAKMARQQKKGNQRLSPWLYDLVLWLLSLLIDLFFREVHPRGAWKVPRKGPIIFVAAPHANQVGSLAWVGE